uniref:Uncharacterized protein n=1 Tax=Glossina pallidipes TaxID=7398 RepID=A0A1A9ZN49_GLOPL
MPAAHPKSFLYVTQHVSLEVPTYVALHKLIANDFLKTQYNYYNDYFNPFPSSSSNTHQYSSSWELMSKSNHNSNRRGKSYKDICRMVNANGFSNPEGVPVCPY